MQSQENSLRVRAPRDGRLAAISSLRCLLAECLCPPRVMPLIIITIFSRPCMLEPLAVGLVPLDRAANSVLEAHLWPPTEFPLNFRAIQGTASIVTGSVL